MHEKSGKLGKVFQNHEDDPQKVKQKPQIVKSFV